MLLTAIFVLGYLAIVFEHPLKLNKSASALVTGVLCWTVHVFSVEKHELVARTLEHQLSEIAGILFFLLSAMTIVELIDAHDGFELITSRITSKNRRKLLVTISLLAFFLSAVLDNLTTSIVMMSLIRKLIRDEYDRMYYGGVVIIAANAGGAWSPIGDVTTTMLWVGGQITTLAVVKNLIFPSLVSIVVPVALIGFRMKGDVVRDDPVTAGNGLDKWLTEIRARLEDVADRMAITLPAAAGAVGKNLAELDLRARTGATVVSITRDGGSIANPSPREPLRAGDVLELSGESTTIAKAIDHLVVSQRRTATSPAERNIVFFAGVGALLFVPVFKTITHLPPVMGILLGLGALWTVTELIHKRKNDEIRGSLTVAGALQRVDAPSVLFFLGILLAIGALQSAGLLTSLASTLEKTIGNVDLITIAIGLASSVVDNVPLVAAVQRMYPLSAMPTDHHFWHFLAYCAGTGGSILIIGSAAGIAVMGIQRISFGWYVRHLSLPALLGYAAGAAAYLGVQFLK